MATKTVSTQAVENAAKTPAAVEAGNIVPFDNSKIKIKRQVTRPLLKQRIGEKVWVKFVSEIFLGEKIEEKKDAAHIANVIDLTKGPNNIEESQYIVPTVLRSELDRAYPKASYKGLCFLIEKIGQDKAGKLYNNFRVVETEAPL
jgi:hypothetical protein